MKRIFNKTWAALTDAERRSFITLLLLDICISLVDIASLAMLVWIVQFYVQPDRSTLAAYLPRWLADRHSITFIAVFVVLFTLKNLAAYFVSRSWYRFIGGIAIRLSRASLQKYQSSAFEEFVAVDSSVHIRRISFQPFEFCQYILAGIQQIITQVFLIGMAIVAIILFDARLFLLLLLILLPPVIGTFYFLKNRLNRAKLHLRSSNEQSFRHLLDALKGYVESNINDRHSFFLKRFIRARENFGKYLFQSISLQTIPPRIIEIFAVLGLFVLIGLAQWSGTEGGTAFVTIGAFMAAAYKIIPGMVKIINTAGQMRAYDFAVDDLAAVGSGQNGIQHPKEDIIQSIELENLQFRYCDTRVLDGINIRIKPGDFLGIVGRSGKGKTTIFNLLLGFLSPENGSIRINDAIAHPEGLRARWPQVAYMRQQSFFLHDTIRCNVTLQDEGHDEDRLRQVLHCTGLDELLSGFSEGLEKVITENGKNISGGQQQRIALARALYKDAPLLLLDEPLNELDDASSEQLMKHFSKMASEGKIVIMITHDKNNLSYCNKILSLDA